MRRVSLDRRVQATLTVRLRERREEIEQAVLPRILALSRPPAAAGPEYVEGLRAAVAAGVEHGISATEPNALSSATTPDALLAQARLAARVGVGLDTVLRRYLAGHSLLADYVLAEAVDTLPAGELKRVMSRLAATVDRVLVSVSESYAEELESRRRGAGRHRADLIERLLSGESIDTHELAYGLGGRHLGIVASGPGAAEASRSLARSLDAGVLMLEREDGSLWAWLGRRQPLDAGAAQRLIAESWPAETTVGLGETAEGVTGWRLTHHQARAAFAVARRECDRLVRYADAALLASVLQDDLLATSLRRLYLEPLEVERDGGRALRETLCAYFGAERNVSSTAIALGVSRKTVNSRLRTVEERIGRPLPACANDLALALRLGQQAGD